MFMNHDMMYYFQQLDAYLRSQNAKLDELTRTIQQLQKEVAQLKEKNSPSVIRNEYKFDLLKVERLEGTLNIGLNPNGSDSSIEEFAVNQTMDVPSPEERHPDLFTGIQQKIVHYLDDEAYEVLRGMEEKYAYPLDDPYRRFILDDVKKQIDKRIHYYVNQHKTAEMEPEQAIEIEQAVIKKVKQDIEKTCEAFIKNLPRKGDESP